MGQLIYGSGLRHFECLKLRIKDINFDLNRIIVVSGKGDKDRVTLLPEKIISPLIKHIHGIKKLYYEDRHNNIPGVELPYALERKYPNAGKEWGWQWVFPSDKLSKDPKSKVIHRHHLHPSFLQRHIQQAALKSRLIKRVTTHSLRHSFAPYLLKAGNDISVTEELP